MLYTFGSDNADLFRGVEGVGVETRHPIVIRFVMMKLLCYYLL